MVQFPGVEAVDAHLYNSCLPALPEAGHLLSIKPSDPHPYFWGRMKILIACLLQAPWTPEASNLMLWITRLNIWGTLLCFQGQHGAWRTQEQVRRDKPGGRESLLGPSGPSGFLRLNTTLLPGFCMCGPLKEWGEVITLQWVMKGVFPFLSLSCFSLSFR